jgi:hypothetical protein
MHSGTRRHFNTAVPRSTQPATSNGGCAIWPRASSPRRSSPSVGELELSDAICVSIAAQGCLPILELGLDYYRGWVGVIVYADEFIIRA